MKARMRKTGEIIAVYEAMPGKYAMIETNGPLMSSIDLEIIPEVKEDKTDWAAFRREAAKDMMCALILSDKNRGSLAQKSCKENARQAIIYADEPKKGL